MEHDILAKVKFFESLASLLISQLTAGYSDRIATGLAEADRILAEGAITPERLDRALAALESNLGPAFAGDLRKNIEDSVQVAYGAQAQRTRRVQADALVFNQVDNESMRFMKDYHIWWSGNAYDLNSAEEFRAVGEKAMVAGLGGDEIGDLFATKFQGDQKKTLAYWTGFGQNIVTQSRVWSDISSFQQAGITQYKIDAVLDDRTSKICRRLDGEVFNVSEAVQLRTSMMEADSPGQVKTIAPWFKPKDLEGLAVLPLATALPPYHPDCRTGITAIT